MNEFYTNGTVDFDAAMARARAERSKEFRRIAKKIFSFSLSGKKANPSFNGATAH
jgi:hypothetical protein